MQLKGPLKLNSHELYAAKDAPVEALWTDEREKSGRLLEALDGTKRYIGPPRFRGRFKFGFDGLTSDEALRVLYELRNGTLNLTPRKNIGGGGAIDYDGDGIPDLILQETSLPVRVTSPIPSTSDLSRQAGGDVMHRIEVECETMQTYEEIPGLTTPPVLTYKAYALYTDPDPTDAWTVGLNVMPQIKMYVDWDDGTTETGFNPTHTYPPDGGPYDISAVLYTSKLDNLGFSGGLANPEPRFDPIRVDVTQTDFSGITVDTFGPETGQGQTIGTLNKAPKEVSYWQTSLGSNIDYDAVQVPRSVFNFLSDGGPGPRGNVNDLPADQEEFVLEDASFSSNVIQTGGPIGPSTTKCRLLRANAVLGSDFKSETIDNNGPAPNVEVLTTDRSQSGIAELMRTMRKLQIINIGPRSSLDLSGVNPIPPTTTELGAGRGFNLVGAGSTFGWLTQLDRLSFNSDGEGNLSKALSITNGVPQYQKFWDGLYNNRTGLKSTLDVALLQYQDNGPGETPRVCTATQASELWRMIGLYSYHPDNGGESVLDYVQSLNLSNILSFDTKSYTSDSVTFDWSLYKKSENDGSDYGKTRRPYVYDDTNTNEPEVWIHRQGSNEWLPLFQPGQQFRLRGATTDKLFEIASQSYDPTTDELTLTIDTGSTQSGVSTSIPENGEVVYGFYFQSQT